MSSGFEFIPPSLLVRNSATDLWIGGNPTVEEEYEPVVGKLASHLSKEV